MNEQKFSAFKGIDVPNYDFIVNCIHCGLCLPHCPTYALTGLEKSSPRGRIRLIKSIADGELGMTQGFIDEMYFCLDCQACESVCPAGVKYGALVEAARAQIEQQGKMTLKEKLLKSLIFQWIVVSSKRLKLLARLIRFYQKSGLGRIIASTKILKLLSPRLHNLHALIPRISSQFSDDVLPEVIRPESETKYRVGFLSGCLMNIMYADVNLDTVRVLQENDCEVIVPRGQKCCGSLHGHNGDMETARKLARHNIDVFESYQFDAIVMNSAGCGAFMKDYGHLLKQDEQYRERAELFSNKVKDLSEFLININFKVPRKEIKKKITYHDACHLVHTQRISREPREVLSKIPGLEFVELNESTWCCGSAGIYNIIRYEDSMKLLDRKMQNIETAHAEVVVTTNPGCLAQISFGIHERKLKMEVWHLATLLNKAYGEQARP